MNKVESVDDIIREVNSKARGRTRFGELDPFCYWDEHLVARITELEAIVEKLPQEVVDRLFAPSDGQSVVALVLEFERTPLDGPGWSRGAVTYQVREAIVAAQAAATKGASDA